MRRRPNTRFRPGLERFEEKQLLSAGASTAHALATNRDNSGASGDPAATRKQTGYLAYRITNPSNFSVNLIPPFQHVLVQRAQPVPGQVYNVLFVAVKNGTAKTFTASDNFTVRLPGFTGTHRVVGNDFPVLTGDQVWRPNQWIVFYVLGKKYYPLSPQVAAGFQLNTDGRSSTLVPGPSGIFLRLKYDPATFDKTLDWIVAYGQGAQLGAGSKLGLPNTAINLLVSAKTKRMDFAGHF